MFFLWQSCANYLWYFREIFSDAESVVGPNDTTVEYGEDSFDLEAAGNIWEGMMPSSQCESHLSSLQISDPDCVYCQHGCEN